MLQECLLLLVFSVASEGIRRFPSLLASSSSSLTEKGQMEIKYEWEEKWFDVHLDHFSYSDSRTFKLRYLSNTKSYKNGGPIFFYTGNEGTIEGFAEATGVMWDLAPTFSAALVFAEHRFYGKTQPFGNDSYTVIAFGGSYGGMLAAWFRLKYSHLTAGAWASSAPVLYFKGGGVDWGAFDAVSTRTFEAAGCDITVIQKGWDSLRRIANNSTGRDLLNKLFQVDKKSLLSDPEDYIYLRNYVNEAITYMAMVDYPYTSTFLTNLPAWPVQESCKTVTKSANITSDEDIVKALTRISNVTLSTMTET